MNAAYPIITVIIPIYNVERYLHRCLDSVLSQTYKNLEVILVDDGSPDRCPEICDEYAECDNRVTVIHKKNGGGLSSARNAALDSPMKGDYVTFVDSDDWIENDYYEYCVAVLRETKADVVQVDYSLATDTNIRKRQPAAVKVNTYEGKEILQYYMTTTTATGDYSVCLNLFSRSLIGSSRFRDGKINEDIDWKYKILRKSKRLAVSNRVMYYYYQPSNSITKGGLKKRDYQLREAADILAQMAAEETYGNIAFLGIVKQARTAFSLLSKIAYFGIADPSIDKKRTVKELTREHRKNVTILLKAPLPLSRKILVVMFE